MSRLAVGLVLLALRGQNALALVLADPRAPATIISGISGKPQYRTAGHGKRRASIPVKLAMDDADASIMSVTFSQRGYLDLAAVDEWLGKLRDRGILRINGVLAFQGANRKYIYQGADMDFNGEWGDEWAEGEERASELVLIGKTLDEAALRAEFVACLATREMESRRLAALRFNVGDTVECYLPGPRKWLPGTVAARRVRRKGLAGVAPYQVKLDAGQLILLPSDDDQTIRTPPRFDVGEAMQSFLRPGLRQRASEQGGEEAATAQSEKCCARETKTLPGACCDTKWMVKVEGS